MADPGTLTCHILFVVGPLLSTVGLFVGPRTFVIGVNGIIYGYGSGSPAWVWVALAYVGYIALFFGAICFKHRALRVMCLMIETTSALLAAKGIAYCI